MNLSQLYYFRKLAELEHYGKASEALFITQPSLSNSISNLEKELGVRLFERVGRNVRLTSYGVEFNEYICVALSEIEKAVNLMAQYGSGLSGQIRLGTVISIQRNFLPRMLNAFRAEVGSNIMFDIHQDTTYGCLDGLNEGKFDVVFCGQPPNKKDLATVPVTTQNLVLGVDKSHELAQRSSVSFSELKGYSLVSYRQESYVYSVLESLFERFGLTAKQAFNDEISAASLVVAEKNIVAVMLETLDDLALNDFVSIPIEEQRDPFYTVYLVYKANAFHSYATERLIEFVKEFTELSE